MSDQNLTTPDEEIEVPQQQVWKFRQFAWKVGKVALILPVLPVVLVRLLSSCPEEEAIRLAFFAGTLTYPVVFGLILKKLIKGEWHSREGNPLLNGIAFALLSLVVCQPFAVLSALASAVYTGILWQKWEPVTGAAYSFVVLFLVIALMVLQYRLRKSLKSKSNSR